MFRKTEIPKDSLVIQISQILQQAASILQEEYTQYCSGSAFEIEHKADTSPVTQADLKSNTFIEAALLKLTPHIPIISEENTHTARLSWNTAWLLDPLDGTKEFLHQRPEFTINLSQISNGKTIFSAIAIPMKKVIYLSKEDELPLKYDWENNLWQRYNPNQVIHTANDHEIIVGLSHRSEKKEYLDFIEKLEHFAQVKIVQAGSAYKFCMMLEGQIDVYPRFHPTCEWDTSAGQGLLESIGGGICDFNKKTFTYNQRDILLNNGFFAFRTEKLKELLFKI